MFDSHDDDLWEVPSIDVSAPEQAAVPAGVAVPHTRAELAMFLWNTAGRPDPATLPAFADVADPELAQAAQWAIEQGYLKARADGSFKPDKGVAKWRVIRGYRAVTEP